MPTETVKTTKETTIIFTKDELIDHCLSLVGPGYVLTDKLYHKRDPYDGDEWIFDGFELTKVEVQ